MIVHNFDPVFIDLGIIQIRWYSIAYIVGILAGWWYGKILITKQIKIINKKIYWAGTNEAAENLLKQIVKYHTM